VTTYDLDAWEEAWIDRNFKVYEPHQDDYVVVGTGERGVGRPMSEPSDIRDVTSTGRKRAAMMYPIFKDMVCEWAGLAKAGGGVEPIIRFVPATLSNPTRAPTRVTGIMGPTRT